MDIRRLTSEVSVSSQITQEDIGDIRAAGFQAIICNRPDGESADPPAYDQIAAAGAKAGLEVRYLPVQSGMVRDQDVAAFCQALSDLPGPVLAYCRSGTRSATLWSLCEAARRPIPEIIAAARAAGYDMSGMAGRMASAAHAPRS